MDDALAKAREALDAAMAELKSLYDRWPYENQFDKLRELFGTGRADALKQLDALNTPGGLNIPDGIRTEVIEGYKKVAEIAANSPPDVERGWPVGLDPPPRGWVLGDPLPEGLQAMRARIAEATLNAIRNQGNVAEQAAETVGRVVEQAGPTVAGAVEEVGPAAGGAGIAATIGSLSTASIAAIAGVVVLLGLGAYLAYRAWSNPDSLRARTNRMPSVGSTGSAGSTGSKSAAVAPESIEPEANLSGVWRIPGDDQLFEFRRLSDREYKVYNVVLNTFGTRRVGESDWSEFWTPLVRQDGVFKATFNSPCLWFQNDAKGSGRWTDKEYSGYHYPSLPSATHTPNSFELTIRPSTEDTLVFQARVTALCPRLEGKVGEGGEVPAHRTDEPLYISARGR
jgi:hypothetical protein